MDEYINNNGFVHEEQSLSTDAYIAALKNDDARSQEKSLLIVDARKTYSKISLMTVIMLLTAMLAINLAVFLLLRFVPSFTNAELSRYDMFLSMVCLNIMAMGIFCVVLKNTGTSPIPRRKKGIGFFFAALCVCIAAMMIGSIMGSSVNSFIDGLFEIEQEPVVEGMTQGRGIIELVFFMAILPGITEEFIFRKLIIDRTAGYSRIGAIFFSAALFGLFHGNFEQFFYAFLVGLVFGYVYTETGNIIYTMALHFLMNIIGAVLPSALQIFREYMTVNEYDAYMGVLIGVRLAMAAAGVVIMILFLKDGVNRAAQPFKKGAVCLTVRESAKLMTANPGSIIMLVFSAIVFVLSAIPLQT